MKPVIARVKVQPALLAWAADRAGQDEAALSAKFSAYPKWLIGGVEPTFKQLGKFASYTHTPLGYLFLVEPPEEKIPIPDFRTFGNSAVPRPSPDLLDTIHDCQMRQEWYRDYAVAEGMEPLTWVGSVTTQEDPTLVAQTIVKAIGFGLEERAKCPSRDAMRKHLIEAIEGTGGLVMVNGVVGADTHRKLDPEEFRGFALSDSLAPVIFVNGADTLGAQVFTLMHELAHLWAGDTALSDASMLTQAQSRKEVWANRVAAEVLVPTAELLRRFSGQTNHAEVERLSAYFRVSTLVVLKRIFDIGRLTWDEYRSAYDNERTRILAVLAEKQTGDGGNFYNTQVVRVSKTFARAVVSDTYEGRTLFRDAQALLGTRKTETYDELAKAVMA